MRLHRFYTGPDLKLKNDFWLHDEQLLWQWNKVLRFRAEQKVLLFNGSGKERMYVISEISKKEAHLKLVTDIETKLPKLHVYLFWSLLKKENNEHIIQKCTELGVSNFVPVISERTIKKDFNLPRARKIAVEASEQCGRSNIPAVREPLHLEKALEEYAGKIQLIVCQQGGEKTVKIADKAGLFIGPEGGWSPEEQKMFSACTLDVMGLGEFTLRAETAATVAVARLLV